MLKASVADDVSSMLSTVVTQGTATRAQIPNTFVAGKTGTTENYGDAWFVGWTDKITVAVWVGYPDELRPMETEFNGQPVAGGTYPAAIWKSFVEQALTYKEYATDDSADEDDQAPISPTPTAPTTPGAPAPETDAPAPDTTAPEGERRRRAARRPRAAGHRAGDAARGAAAARPAGAAAARAAGAAVGRHRAAAAVAPRYAARRRPAGHGRDTLRDPTAQKRHGSSAALVIPMRVPVTTSTSSQPGGRGPIRSGPRTRSVPLCPSSIPSAWVSLPGPGAELLDRVQPAPLAHRVERGDRLERADQHRRADALGLADRVDERVDPVGAVDVRDPGAAEQHLACAGSGRRTRGRPARTRGRPRSRRSPRPCARARACSRRGRGRPRAPGGRRTRRARRRHAGWPSSSARAWLSCSRTRASAVPPSDTLDSSQDRWASTA